MNYGKDNTMELKDFIKATIKDISNAVTELNEEMSDKGLLVNPIPETIKMGWCIHKMDVGCRRLTSMWPLLHRKILQKKVD